MLVGNPACLVMMNINSYAAGTNKIWNSSKGQLGIEGFQKNNRKGYLVDNFKP